MCVICVSKSGKRQPTKKEFQQMWNSNPDGAGYMYARDGKVYIHKGFMSFKEFWRNVCAEEFTKEDAVVYHFRIATQGGINPQMTHPFALTKTLDNTRALDVSCPLGVAHNGVIKLTSDGDKEFSDTAKYITQYLVKLVRKDADIRDPFVLDLIEESAGGRWALLDKSGYIALAGNWVTNGQLMYSNENWKAKYRYAVPYEFDY